MRKDFDSWNNKKKVLDTYTRTLIFKEGEIWWCHFGLNIGEEVYGKGEHFRRPVIVFKKFSKNTCMVIPTTTQTRVGSWYFPFTTKEKERWAMMNQMRFVSANRLSVKESEMHKNDFHKLKKSVTDLLGLP